ncbi:hypothetical protein [Rhizobium ruizarguesonis]|uniref:hypothetical protein n=1 Tax=Rhizobium ruizarguesonis TaxID=2081791 RepID=UPI0013BFFE9C|nr:hypothetical protein [Rhizobium ruizarguesonis]NEI96394.1 hypothetical protein [Rhizobium ruizarguesonis]NEJ33983.1 hypothetical protein [Rhizobium ruizarguesonis]
MSEPAVFSSGLPAIMERGEYERDICARSGSAVDVRYEPDASIGAWTTKVAECHANVDYWVAHHEGYAAVRGWLAHIGCGDLHGYTAHSVLRDPHRELVDITPVEGNFHRRFIPHLGDDATFLRMRTPKLEILCQGNCPAPAFELEWVNQPTDSDDPL